MPSDMRNGKVRSKDRIFVYRETAEPFDLASDLDQEVRRVSYRKPGNFKAADKSWSTKARTEYLPENTKVLSYFVHVDSEGEVSTCKMKFSTKVLGFQGMAVRASQDAIDATHAALSPETDFCTRTGVTACARPMENGDNIILAEDQQTVTVTSRSLKGYVDQLRVLVQPKELPEGMKACPKGCAAEACPVNCLVDIWQPWGACSVSCGTGERQRKRWVLDEGTESGEVCPPLTEEKPCTIECTPAPTKSAACTAAPTTWSPTAVPTAMPSFQCLPTQEPVQATRHPTLMPSSVPSRTPSVGTVRGVGTDGTDGRHGTEHKHTSKHTATSTRAQAQAHDSTSTAQARHKHATAQANAVGTGQTGQMGGR